MKSVTFPLIAALILTTITAFPQSSVIDGTLGFAKKQISFAAHYSHIWKLGKKKKWGVGVGGRATSFLGSDQYYITAPSKLTSESTSPLIFFTEIIEENIDTFLIKSPQVNAINLSINFNYQLTQKLTAGFSIDALGFSFGADKEGTHINGTSQQQVNAAPTSFNILLISDNDRGSLNSEIFGRYSINDKFGIKGGLQFLFTEYTTDRKVQTDPEENDRFRLKSFMVALGVSYSLN